MWVSAHPLQLSESVKPILHYAFLGLGCVGSQNAKEGALVTLLLSYLQM